MGNPITLKICEGRACKARFSSETKTRAQNDIKQKNLQDVNLEDVPCQGHCEKGPTVIFKDGKKETTLHEMTPLKMGALMKKIK